MKKIFTIVGLISLACFSFYITDKTTTVVQNVDNIMVQIKNNYHTYEISPKDATINNDTIIPGVYGYKVDIKKSYKNMRKYGYYNENLYIYKGVKPHVSLSNNLDKYIIFGNQSKREVSLIIKVYGSYNIDNILNIIKKNDITASFFVDDSWFSNNNDLALELIKEGHTIGNLSYNLDYQNSSFGWMDTIIKNLGHQKQGYCYYTDNRDNVNACVLLKNYTIKPTEITNNPLLEVKNNLQSGSMLSFNADTRLERELDSIISYIKTKGYNIVNLEYLLSEK